MPEGPCDRLGEEGFEGVQARSIKFRNRWTSLSGDRWSDTVQFARIIGTHPARPRLFRRSG